MARWTEADLKGQFESAKSKGWLRLFETSAAAHAFPTELLIAIASRETNIRQIKGDFRGGIYHGYGLMQIDIGTDSMFCRAWTPEKVGESIERGAQILAAKRQYLIGHGIQDLKAVAAAYNTGEGRVRKSIEAGDDPDQTTTGHDYGADVMARMEVFTRLLAGPPENA